MLGGEGLGALAGSFLYGRLAARVKRRTFLIAAMLLLTLPIFPLAMLPNQWLATGLLALIGIGSGLVNPMIGTFVQVSTPASLLGRVGGLIILVIGCALMVVLVMLWANRSLHELDREIEAGM